MASKPLDEEPVFTLSVILRSEMSELWRVEKAIGVSKSLSKYAFSAARLKSTLAGECPLKILLSGSRNSYMASKPLDEEPVFTLSVILRSEMSELWRVEKYAFSAARLKSTLAGECPLKILLSGNFPGNGEDPIPDK
jgi:formate dehydrogenase assembly factor FdhD